MKTYKPYPKYKNSNIPWLGEIPEHWRNWKVSRGVKSIGSGTTPSSGNKIYYENGTINWLNTGDFNDSILKKCKRKVTELAIKENSALKIFPKGTLSIAMYGATIGKVCIVDFETTTNQACCNIIEGDVFDNKFLMYWFIGNKKHIVNLSYGGGQPNISQDVIKSLIVPSPEKEEQTAIARFLDYKLAKTNRFIQKKKQLIKLLNEQKAAIINQAVTKGLEPNVKMKPSGIDGGDLRWLGDIPEHWEVRKLKYLANFQSGEMITSETIADFGEFPVYGGGGFRGYTNGYTNEGHHVLIGRQGALCGNIKYAEGKFWASEHAIVTYPKIEIETFFLGEIMRVANLGNLSQTAAQPGISIGQIKNVKVPIPPLKEQSQIVDFISKETAIINTTISKIEKELALTEEYKTALIAEAVTGKIDVREYQVPEITEEETYEEIEEELGMVAEDTEEYQTIEE